MLYENITIYEYVFPAITFIFYLAVISPTRWKSNLLILIASFVYFGIRLYTTNGFVTVTFVGSMWGTWFYYFMASITLNRKVKDLYASIQKWERLIEEQKRILTFFPDCVIIQNNIDESKWETIFTNNEFDSQIIKIRNRICELEDVKVSFSKSEIDESDIVVTSLKATWTTSTNSPWYETVNQQKVTIWWKEFNEVGRQLNESGDENLIQKLFSVKSMKVNWEDKNWFMHVFTDTTDIVKLEEAKIIYDAKRSCLQTHLTNSELLSTPSWTHTNSSPRYSMNLWRMWFHFEQITEWLRASHIRVNLSRSSSTSETIHRQCSLLSLKISWICQRLRLEPSRLAFLRSELLTLLTKSSRFSSLNARRSTSSWWEKSKTVSPKLKFYQTKEESSRCCWTRSLTLTNSPSKEPSRFQSESSMSLLNSEWRTVE